MGRENDCTGLYYYRARYYSPAMKRFISEDPLGLAAGLNSYAYVDGNPISSTDPQGLESPRTFCGAPRYGSGWAKDCDALPPDPWIPSDPYLVMRHLCDARKKDDPFGYLKAGRDKYPYDLSWRDAEHYVFAQDELHEYPRAMVAGGVLWQWGPHKLNPLHRGTPPTGSELFWGFKALYGDNVICGCGE